MGFAQRPDSRLVHLFVNRDVCSLRGRVRRAAEPAEPVDNHPAKLKRRYLDRLTGDRRDPYRSQAISCRQFVRWLG